MFWCFGEGLFKLGSATSSLWSHSMAGFRGLGLMD